MRIKLNVFTRVVFWILAVGLCLLCWCLLVDMVL